VPARESSQPSASRGVSESTRADLPIAECWFDGEGNSSESESAVKRDGYSWTRQVGRGAASFAIPEGVSLVRPACNSPHRPGADRVPSCQKNAARRRAGHFLRATSGSKAKTVVGIPTSLSYPKSCSFGRLGFWRVGSGAYTAAQKREFPGQYRDGVGDECRQPRARPATDGTPRPRVIERLPPCLTPQKSSIA